MVNFDKLMESAFIELHGTMFRMIGVQEENDGSLVAHYEDEDSGEQYTLQSDDLDGCDIDEIRYFQLTEIV